MKRSSKLSLIVGISILLLIIIDQIVKIWIKTNMSIGEHIAVFGDWFYIYFVENEGMAFGISLGEKAGKLILSVVRIGVVGFLIYYLRSILKKEKTDWVVISIFSLIIAGALGNIVDCIFYGQIFSQSTPHAVATMFPADGGYAPFMLGKVVDMFYFPLFKLPEGFPIWGGHYFFPAIFNVADICVTVGIFLLLVFNKRIFVNNQKDEVETSQQKIIK